jgi:hypothetical protein
MWGTRDAVGGEEDKQSKVRPQNFERGQAVPTQIKAMAAGFYPFHPRDWFKLTVLRKTLHPPQHKREKRFRRNMAQNRASHSAEGLNLIPPCFFVLVLFKILQVLPECSRTTFAQNKKFCPNSVLWGPKAGCVVVTSDSPPYTKA